MRVAQVIVGAASAVLGVFGTAVADSSGLDTRSESGNWSFRIDGDVAVTRIERPDWTNRAGNTVRGISRTDELILLRPSLRYGDIGSGFWGAAKAELGSGGRRFFDHQTNGPASGFGVVLGYDNMWIATGNGYLNDPLDQDISQAYLSPISPSYLDGSYAPLRRSDPLNVEFLDAGYLWSTMVAQIQEDDLDAFGPDSDAVGHSTVSAGIRTAYGNFRILTDTNGNAQELSWGKTFERGQVQLVAAQVNGVVDRWDNDVSDRYYGASLGFQIAPNWTAGVRHFFTDGDTRANTGWGDGSNSTALFTNYEVVDGHHVFGRATFNEQFRTNAAANVVETIDSDIFEIGYLGQLNENVSGSISLNLNESASALGQADTIETIRASLAVKW